MEIDKDKWRAGSNYIVLSLFEEAVAAGRSVIYGTTSTGAHIPNFFAKLKENGYQIVLLLCSCPDNLRYEAVANAHKVEVSTPKRGPADLNFMSICGKPMCGSLKKKELPLGKIVPQAAGLFID